MPIGTEPVVDGFLPLSSLSAWGMWNREIIFFRYRGGDRRRSVSVYDLSVKPHLIPYQSKFALAVAAWQVLPDPDKKYYSSTASRRGLQLSGYNFFISLFLKDKL